MPSVYLITFTIMLAAILITPGFANTTIRCFQCSSYQNPDCADIQANDTTSPFLHQCEPRTGFQIFCRKTVQTILDVEKTVRVTRSCGWLKNNRSDCRKSDTDFKLETTCQCFTDACNTGSRLINANNNNNLSIIVGLFAFLLCQVIIY